MCVTATHKAADVVLHAPFFDLAARTNDRGADAVPHVAIAGYAVVDRALATEDVTNLGLDFVAAPDSLANVMEGDAWRVPLADRKYQAQLHYLIVLPRHVVRQPGVFVRVLLHLRVTHAVLLVPRLAEVLRLRLKVECALEHRNVREVFDKSLHRLVERTGPQLRGIGDPALRFGSVDEDATARQPPAAELPCEVIVDPVGRRASDHVDEGVHNVIFALRLRLLLPALVHLPVVEFRQDVDLHLVVRVEECAPLADLHSERTRHCV